MNKLNDIIFQKGDTKMDNGLSSVALRLKTLRAEKGITQKQLSEKTGIAYSTIIGYENGKREPNSKAMAALEDYFGVSGAYLRGESDQRDPPFKWDDTESMEAVRQSLPPVLKNLSDAIAKCNSRQQKLIFDIVTELHRAIANGSDSEKDFLIDALHADVESTILDKQMPSTPTVAEAEGDIFDKFTDAEIRLFTRFLLYRGISEDDDITPVQVGMLQSAALILDTAFPVSKINADHISMDA
ncbi:helix-turn-helix domain-containing protein [Anaeromassilibacillus sp. SJQ-1]|uniref:helix-turn-helix domain-containing protein n=1 Tax=Anaeromassilibacillus sp. SJQ-1 TaxID=3375419 RepID=UPI003988CEF2